MAHFRRGGIVLLLATAWMLGTPSISAAQKKERDVITREEIEGSAQRDQDVYAAIRSLRPHFLQPPRGNHGGATYTAIVLYVNGSREPNLDALRRMSASMVQEVRYLDPSKAEMEYGSSASGGAIVLTTVKPEDPPAGHD